MLLRRRLIAANVVALATLALVWAATATPGRIKSPDLPPGPAVVLGFEVANDLSTARVDLALRATITTDAGVLDGSSLKLPLQIESSGEMQATTANLRLHGQIVGRITVEYYSRVLYERIGTTDPGYVLLVTDLPRQGLERERVAVQGPIDPNVVAIVASRVRPDPGAEPGQLGPTMFG
jgi:hypothetical protein